MNPWKDAFLDLLTGLAFGFVLLVLPALLERLA